MKVKRRRCIHTVFSVYHFFLFRSYSSAAKFTRWLHSDFYQGFKQINSLTLILLGCSKHFGCIESFRQRGVQLAPHDLDAGWGYQGTKNSLLYSIQIYCSIWAQNTRGMVLVSGLVKEMFALMTTIMLRGVQSDRFACEVSNPSRQSGYIESSSELHRQYYLKFLWIPRSMGTYSVLAQASEHTEQAKRLLCISQMLSK
jgi:hypothetical protein